MPSYFAEEESKTEKEDGGQSSSNPWEFNLNFFRLTRSPQEEKRQEEALDYEKRFCGHCNTTTDIKEANFFGE